MNNKLNPAIIIGISLPILMIILVASVIYVPSFLVKPQHNFVYSDYRPNYDYYNYTKYYDLVDGQIVEKLTPGKNTQSEVVYAEQNKIVPKLYLYDVKEHSSKEISLQDANKFSLVAGPSSPDGFSLEYEYGNNGIFELFGSSGRDRGLFLKKGMAKERLSISNTNYYYGADRFSVIAWIK